MDKEIPYSGAVLGITISVPTLEGKQFKVKVPPGVQPNAKLRLKGHGLPDGPIAPRGDIMVRIAVAVPKEINEEQKELINKLADAGL
jgi:curved DNA-binding protein